MTDTVVQINRKKILIIDDEKKLLFGLKAVMTRAGYDILTASEGSEGVRLAKESLPDVIICDVMMPPPNGFQLKKILANDLQTAAIPFIFLTARTGESDKIAGLNQGADDYITKPFNVDEMIARVQAILRRNELGRQSALQEMGTKVEKVRRSIATNLSHEMRTPLGVILSGLDLAIREKSNGVTDNLDLYLEASLSSAQKLSVLIFNLILLNDIDTGKVNKFRKPVDLKFHFIDPVQKVLKAYAEKNLDVHISIQPGTLIHASEVEFAHVVSHLVDNACKFSPDGGKIRIRLNRNGMGGCSLLVENEGPAIPVELREKVFERYYQVQQDNSRLYGGLGVGLTIARAVAEAFGGSVSILDSAVGCKVRMVYAPGAANWGSALSGEGLRISQEGIGDD